MKKPGVDDHFVPAPVNFYQNTPTNSDSTLETATALTAPGDYVELKAQVDFLLIVTACSVDEGSDINDSISTPLRVDVATN